MTFREMETGEFEHPVKDDKIIVPVLIKTKKMAQIAELPFYCTGI